MESKTLTNKKIIITGASSGIGKAAAINLAKQGASLILVSRREDLLQEVADEISSLGGSVQWYTADLSNLEQIDKLTSTILSKNETIDILINNAGRSIRRPMVESLERFHDFERCMTINYFAPVRLVRNLLPALQHAANGHIINSSTWGTLLPASGFGPYNASKIALDNFSNTLRMEMKDKGISVTQIHFPLVHTKMSSATESFKKLPGMSTEQAANWIAEAIKKKPREIMNTQTRIARFLYFIFPKFVEKKSLSSPFSI